MNPRKLRLTTARGRLLVVYAADVMSVSRDGSGSVVVVATSDPADDRVEHHVRESVDEVMDELDGFGGGQ